MPRICQYKSLSQITPCQKCVISAKYRTLRILIVTLVNELTVSKSLRYALLLEHRDTEFGLRIMGCLFDVVSWYF